tara:strand:- start:946 stop:1545 length:600 start_codon:yes stop_codon:yes gene_type:complete
MNPEIITTLNDLLSNKGVSPNTQQFLQSLKDQWDRNGTITQKQMDAITTVKERYETREKEAEGFEYTPEKKARAIICAQYYKNTPYFTQLADNVLMDEDFVPTPREYAAMCNNRYANKIVEATMSPAKYPVGSYVKLRSNALWKMRNSLKDTPAVVLKTDYAPVKDAAKGTKRYLILFFGNPKPYDVQERHIKNARIKV